MPSDEKKLLVKHYGCLASAGNKQMLDVTQSIGGLGLELMDSHMQYSINH